MEFLNRANRDGKLTEDFIESLTGRAAPRITLHKALSDWISESEVSTSRATVEKYRAIAADFSAFIGATEKAPLLRDVTTEECRTFLTNKRKTCSASTANLHRKILSLFFGRGVKDGSNKVNPVASTKPAKAGRGEVQSRRPFTLAELRLIYEKAPSTFWRYMVVAGFHTGLRMGDLISMLWGSVDLEKNLLRVTTRKTDTPVQIPMSKALLAVFHEILAKTVQGKPNEPIWPEQAARYDRFGSRVFSAEFHAEVLAPAGLVTSRDDHRGRKEGRAAKRDLSGPSFHSLRHSFISLLRATGGSQAVAKELAGHSSDAISDHYTSLPVETLAAAIENLPDLK